MTLFSRTGGRAWLLAAIFILSSAFTAPAAFAAAPFMVPRYGQSVALMPNGKILVVGGADATNTPLSSVEVLDTTKGSEYVATAQGALYVANPGGAMAFARSSATITVLPNGNVLVTGGWDGAIARTDAEVYNPLTNVWTTVGGMQIGRYNHTATLLLTGNVLVCGGQTGAAPVVTATCDLFTPSGASGSFAPTGSMLLGRSLHTATILNDGTVWVAGGWNPGAANLNPPFVVTTERYSTATGAWQQSQPLNAARAYHSATLTGDNKVLIVGGNNNKVASDSLPIPPNGVPTLQIPRLGVLNSSEIFDPTGGSIVPGPPLQARVGTQGAVLLPSGQVSIFGGRGNIPPQNVTSFSPALIFNSGVVNGSYNGTYSNHVITGGNGNIPLKFTLGTPVSGTILDGDVEFINPRVTLSGASVAFASNYDVAGTGLRVSLKGASVGCDTTGLVCGLVNSSFNLANVTQGTYAITVPVASASSLASQAVAGSLTISPGPLNLTTNSGVANVTGGNFTTHLQIVVPSFLTGLSVSSVTLTLTPGSTAGWTEKSSYTVTLNGGSGLAVGPFAVLTAAGVNYIDIPAFTFNSNLAGTLIDAATDPSYSIPATVPVPLGNSAKLDNINFSMQFAASGVNLTGQTLLFDSADIIIRDMIFGDNEFFVPSNNQWSFVPPKVTLKRPSLPRTGVSSLVTPSGSEFDIGGRECNGGCAALVAAAGGAGGSRLDPATVWTSGPTTTIAASDPLAHAFHTASLLPDGTILLAGGTDGSTVLPFAEIFDPVALTFTPTATPMKFPRQQHSASVLPNGRVLLAGGFTANALSTGPSNSSEFYYPDTKVFLTAPVMISSRSQHTAITLPNGNVFVAGGYNGINTVTGSAEIFSSTAVVWSPAADMTTLGATKKRAIAAAVQLQDGRIMLCGGTNENGILNSAIAYDPVTNAWSNLANMPVGLQGHTATLLFDGRVLVAGGNDGFGETTSSYIYDPIGDAWSVANPLKTGRFGHSATLLPNGAVMIVGGVQQTILASGSPANAVQTMETFVPDFAFWADGGGGNLLTAGARAFHTATLAPNGQIYLIGGANGSIGAGQTSAFYNKVDAVYFTLFPDQSSKSQPSLRQSTITFTTASAGPVLPATSFNVTGLRFRGATEASGGSGSANSSFSTPRLMLGKIDGSNGGGSSSSPGFVADMTQAVYANPLNQTTLDTSLTVTLPNNKALPFGWYMTWVGNIDIHTARAAFVQVGPPKPAAAVTFQAPTVLSTSSIAYTWTGVSPPCDGYNVYSSTTGIFITTIAYNGTGVGGTSFTYTNLAANTTTSILVAPYTMTGDGPLAASATTFTLATAPVSVKLTSVTFNSLLVQWSPNGNSTGTVYEVTQSTDWPAPFSQSVSTPVAYFLGTTKTEASIGQLLPNTTYSFRIQGFNLNAIGGAFSVVATTQTRSPVSGVQGKALSSTSIAWSWNSAGAVTYKVYNATSNAVLITTTSTGFTDVGLGTNTSRAIAVSAVTGAGEGPLSTSATTFTLASVPALLNPALTGLTTSSFVVGWGANGNPNGTIYRINLIEYNDFGVFISTINNFGFTFDTLALGLPLKASARYDTAITAINGDNLPSPQLVISTYTLAQVPQFVAPSTPTFLATTPTTIGVQWDRQGSSTYTFYEVTYSTDPTFVLALSTPVPFAAKATASSATLTNLLTSYQYFIRVRGMNPNGQVTQYSFSTNTITVNGGAAPGSLAGPLSPVSNSFVSGNLGDGRYVNLFAPPGAFPSATTATIAPFNVVAGTTLCPRGFNVAVDISVDPGFQPTAPLYFTADYDPASIGAVPTSQIAMMRYDPSGVCVPLDTVFFPNTLPRPTFRARLNHFSRYQLVQIPLATSAGTARIFPNPYRAATDGYVTIDQVPPGARVRVMTLRGETLLDQAANSIGLINWIPSNGAGRTVASGLYIVLIEAGGSQKTLKLAVIR